MKILFFRDYKEEHWTSMDVYADNLASHLRLIYGKTLSISQQITLPNISRFFSSKHKQIRQVFRYIVNPIGSFMKKADVYHITDHANAHLLAILDPKKTVVTCHDLTAPFWMMGYVKPTLKKRVKHAIERWRVNFLLKAAKVIVVSESTKHDLMTYLHMPEENIVVIPEGVSPLFKPCTDKERLSDVIRKYQLPAKFILHVGTNYYNKNIQGLLSLFFRLARDDKSLYLVKVGEQWTDEQLQTISLSAYSDKICHIGYIDILDLPVIYSLSQALIQPSYAEGFGFTVLEAMACGCPVVVNSLPALKELVADNGIQISHPPTNENIKKIQRLLSDRAYRLRFLRLGIRRAHAYSWDTCAKSTYEVYKEIVRLNHQS